MEVRFFVAWDTSLPHLPGNVVYFAPLPLEEHNWYAGVVSDRLDRLLNFVRAEVLPMADGRWRGSVKWGCMEGDAPCLNPGSGRPAAERLP